jgi:NHLM bacteriocin system ABC transporter ATP-binding protein
VARFFEGQPQDLPGNTAFLANTPEQIWIIQSGALDVFSVTLQEGRPFGARRYLFSLEVGESLWGFRVAPDAELAVLAVAVGETRLAQMSALHLAAAMVSEDPLAARLFGHWLQRLSPILLQASAESEMMAALESATGSLVEVDEADHLLQNLDRLHGCFLQCLENLEIHALRIQTDRFERRESRNLQASQTAVGKLMSVLESGHLEGRLEGSPLLVAAQVIGQAMGIAILQPSRSEDLSRIQDPLEAIARASRVRLRQVELHPGFEQRDSGPLLAYTQTERAPVALLPYGRRKYQIFDPRTMQRTPYTEDCALAADAYMFYRPLPEKRMQTFDLISFALQNRRWDNIWVLVAAVSTALLGIITPTVTGWLVDLAIPQANQGLMLQMGLGLFVCAAASATFGLAQGLLSLRVESLADAATQAAVWDRVLNLKPQFFRNYASGDLNARIMGITEIRRRLSGTTLRTLFSGFFSLLNLILMFTCSPPLTGVALVLALIVIVFTAFHGRIKLGKVKILQKIRGEIFGLTVQLINGIAKLRVAGAEERAFAHWADTYSQQQKLNYGVQFIEDSLAAFTQVLPLISAAAIFWFTYTLMPSRTAQVELQAVVPFSIGSFLAFNAAFNIFIRGVAALSTTLVDSLEVVNLWERALPILEADLEVSASSEDPGRLSGRLALEKVTFRYTVGGATILDNVSIHAAPGEFIAIVGDSGSGKSTLFRLLLGFEVPQTGSVTYDSQDLCRLDVRAVRRQLGVVLQNGKVQTGSIFSNISKGAVITLDEAWEAARQAGLAADIQAMPMGMNTVISEDGGNISGGQRQRLLIAQALCLKPRILLFDEATSALDNRTQSIVSESLEQLQVTRIVIAHRLSTIRQADRIYVMSKGQIVQQGRFEELIHQEGLFAQLASRQIA